MPSFIFLRCRTRHVPRVGAAGGFGPAAHRTVGGLRAEPRHRAHNPLPRLRTHRTRQHDHPGDHTNMVLITLLIYLWARLYIFLYAFAPNMTNPVITLLIYLCTQCGYMFLHLHPSIRMSALLQ
jgi:hypothetical protein